jgi:hypothetical protein
VSDTCLERVGHVPYTCPTCRIRDTGGALDVSCDLFALYNIFVHWFFAFYSMYSHYIIH